MTREEAIKELLNMKKINYTLAPDECFDKAIKALERENTLLDRVLEIIDSYRIQNTKNILAEIHNELIDLMKSEVKTLKGGDGE